MLSRPVSIALSSIFILDITAVNNKYSVFLLALSSAQVKQNSLDSSPS